MSQARVYIRSNDPDTCGQLDPRLAAWVAAGPPSRVAIVRSGPRGGRFWSEWIVTLLEGDGGLSIARWCIVGSGPEHPHGSLDPRQVRSIGFRGPAQGHDRQATQDETIKAALAFWQERYGKDGAA